MPTLQPEDPFEAYCRDNNFTSEAERAEAFVTYMADTTGWDGSTTGLSEDERHWISRANEIVEWLKAYAVAHEPHFIEAALRTLATMRPIPKSLTGLT